MHDLNEELKKVTCFDVYFSYMSLAKHIIYLDFNITSVILLHGTKTT